MLERKPDAMITAAINSTILLPCLKRANSMGIPVVDLDGNLDHKSLRMQVSVSLSPLVQTTKLQVLKVLNTW